MNRAIRLLAIVHENHRIEAARTLKSDLLFLCFCQQVELAIIECDRSALIHEAYFDDEKSLLMTPNHAAFEAGKTPASYSHPITGVNASFRG